MYFQLRDYYRAEVADLAELASTMSLVSYLSNLGPLVPTREHDARKESMEQFHCAGHSGINLSCAHSIYCSTFIWPVVLQCGMFFVFFFFARLSWDPADPMHAHAMQPLPPAAARFENVAAELVSLNKHL